MDRRILQRFSLAVLLPVFALAGCQREAPTDNGRTSQPSSPVDQAAQQAVDAIKTPMDKARGVEGTLGEAAERTADGTRDGSR